MSETPLLHNMSVPPVSTVTVRRAMLPGPRFLVDLGTFRRQDVKALRTGGAAAVLDLLGGTWDGNPEELLRARMLDALSQAGIPDRTGVFLEAEAGDSTATRVSRVAALAIMARRSGPLYRPRRPFNASLIVARRLVLLFPDT